MKSMKRQNDAVPEPKRLHNAGLGKCSGAAPLPKRLVCDHCRRRRIRCDGQFPCKQCTNAVLTCKRDHKPQKRGPKRGRGRVINELRARDEHDNEKSSRGSSVEVDSGFCDGIDGIDGIDGLWSGSNSISCTPPAKDASSWIKVTSDSDHAPEPRSMFSSEAYRPTSRSYLHLIPKCIELYYEHIYPIMPLLYMPQIRTMVNEVMTTSDKSLIYALCSLTSFHMSGKTVDAPGLLSWDEVGRFFLDECVLVRQSYDFLEDLSIHSIISSFWLSTSFFEINQSRKSWFYLREALTLALELGLHDDSTYIGLGAKEKLCRQRVFWILFVTERSYAILRNKPLTFKKTPSLPASKHEYEAPGIHAGFMQLISSYTPLDEAFVTAWNDGSDPSVSGATYLALQDLLAVPPAFQSPCASRPATRQTSTASAAPSAPEPTAIQKADLLVTRQWLRLVVWQSSFRQGLLRGAAPHASMRFAYPLAVARDTAAVLRALPPAAVEVHGMGIFEKIFEIASWCLNVLDASGAVVGSGPGSGGGGRSGSGAVVVEDPLAFFVGALSASPNSRARFADRLLLFAGQRPAASARWALAPVLPAPGAAPGGGGGSGGVRDVMEGGEEGRGVGATADGGVLAGFDGLDVGLGPPTGTSSQFSLPVTGSLTDQAMDGLSQWNHGDSVQGSGFQDGVSIEDMSLVAMSITGYNSGNGGDGSSQDGAQRIDMGIRLYEGGPQLTSQMGDGTDAYQAGFVGVW